MPTPDEERLNRIFFPYMDRKNREAIAVKSRFVYYTTADTAASILRNRQLWMRNTTAMNDYMEVEHGLECLNPAYKVEQGERFRAALDAYFPGLATKLLEYFNGWLHHIRSDTYMMCVSEHSPEVIRGTPQQVILSAFHRLLEEAGVAERGKKVVVSAIPLRNP